MADRAPRSAARRTTSNIAGPGAAQISRTATRKAGRLVTTSTRGGWHTTASGGDQNVDAVEIVIPHAELADGMDHEALVADLAVAWPDAERWLLAHSTPTG
jgi:hypothetical protein